MRATYLTILFLLALPVFSVAQTYSTSLYTIEDGMVQSQIRSIGQDKHGYLWFGSYTSGASRFNGNEFESFTLDNGLCANTIHEMLEDKDQSLWFGTYGDGVCKYDGETFTNYGPEDGLVGGKIYSMMEASNGLLYFGTDSGVVRFNGKSFTSLHDLYPNFKRDLARAIVQADDGTIYIGGTRKGIVKLQNEKITYLKTEEHRLSVFSLLLDRNQNLWIGTRKGVYKYENDSIRHLSKNHVTEKKIIRCFYQDSDGKIWVGSTAGLFQMNGDQFHKIHLHGATELVNAQEFYTDREGNTWVASQLGAFLLKKPVFQNYTQLDGLPHNYVFAIHKHENKHWFGGYDGGITIISEKDTAHITMNDGLKSGRIFALDNDPSNETLYIGSSKGLNQYRNGQIESPEHFNLLDGKKVYDLMVDSKGRLWAGTADNGCTVFISSDSAYTFNEKNGLSNNRVFAIDEDNNGHVWIATDNGINKVKGNQVILTLQEDDGLHQNRSQDILVDHKNNIWISHNTGVSYYDGKKFRSFTTKEGLSSSSIFLLAFDKDHQLWLGNNKSLDKVDLDAFYQENRFQVKTYDRSNGYIGMEANQKATYVDENGVWFGSINGVTYYNPKNETINQNKPRMIITALNLFYDQPLDLDSTLSLGYRENHLTFNFIGLSYYSPERTQYSYRLSGQDEEWSPPSKETSATYSNLSPGEYTFEVKAKNEDGIWSEPTKINFVIIPPFWQTTWFYILCVILLGILIYLFISYRTKKLIRDKQFLEAEVTKRTKELNDANVTIERKNKDITDSINYAKRIQSALLPDDTEMRYAFDSFFHLYKPKDIVSGDFYWFHDFGEMIVCAVGDCTGHGVPGALMSVICVTQINKHVKSDAVQAPEHALQLINNGIVETLRQQVVNVNSYDGMDIAMCAYNKKTGELNYAGAYRPLIIVRNKKLMEYSPNRFSLGGEILPKSKYKGHTINLKPNDCVYMFTDGYPDQFGGPKGKKYMTKRFKQLLVEISELPFEKQREKLETNFREWRQNHEQVDDILVMGFKVSE